MFLSLVDVRYLMQSFCVRLYIMGSLIGPTTLNSFDIILKIEL